MEIRLFKEVDSEEVKNLIDKILKEEFSLDYDILSDEDLNNLNIAYEGPRNTLLVVEEQSKIIGVVGVKEETEDVALIRRLFVHHGYRGKKYGRTLLHRALDFCKIKGYKHVLFRSTNQMKAAINLCLKNGFEKKSEQDLGQAHIIELILNIET